MTEPPDFYCLYMLTSQSLEKIIDIWIKDAIFFIGASWYKNNNKIKTLKDISSELQVRWLNNNNVSIEQKYGNDYHWLESYYIGNQNPFILDCFSRNYVLSQLEMLKVEEIIKLHLPYIDIVGCYHCGSRFQCEVNQQKWICDRCSIDFSSKNLSGFVYVFGSIEKGYFKIGCSNYPISRMRDYASGKLPFQVEMIHQIPVDNKFQAEAELHRLFREYHTNGEWYNLPLDELNKITQIDRYVSNHWIKKR